MADRQEQMAVDWEAKSIPLYAYKNCLTIKESLLLAKQNPKLMQFDVLFQKFVSAVSIFYDSVENEFIAFYVGSVKDEALKRWQIVGKTPTLQEIQSIAKPMAEITNDRYDQALLIFRLIKNWCFQYGPFKTYVKAHNPSEAFQYD